MDKQSTSKDLLTKNCKKTEEKLPKKSRKKSIISSSVSESSSHTHFFRQTRITKDYKRISRNEYHNISESVSSDDTFNCFHKGGRQYSPEGLLKRNLLKELDPIPIDKTWTENCQPVWGWELAEKLVFLLTDQAAAAQTDRLQEHLRDFIKLSTNGYRIDVLDDVTEIVDILLTKLTHESGLFLREYVVKLVQNMRKPIKLIVANDTVKSFDKIEHFLGFLGYLLTSVEDNDIFDLVSEAILWHLKSPDSERDNCDVRKSTMLAAASILIEPVCNLLALTSSRRYLTFVEMALVLALYSEENCIKMMKEEVIENLFCRFNPYFPKKDLEFYDIGPADPQDINVQLGVSSIYLSEVMTTLLVLLKTTIQYLEKHPEDRQDLRCPVDYSLRCFAWAYRYECLARDHGHQRVTLTIIASALIKCYKERMNYFTTLILADVMSLSVLTEIPKTDGWIGKVKFNTMQLDVHFKKVLIYLVVDMLKMFPCNRFMVTSRYWLLGMMYLLDPSLSCVRQHWSTAHYSELRKIAFQALILTIPICDPKLIKQYALIRRLLWYVEWYTDHPYNINDLYWCMRLLQTTVSYKDTEINETSVQDLYDTHGIIILVRLCYNLMEQKLPPVEKCQAVLSLSLRMLASAVETDRKRKIICSVYPNIRWPEIIFPLTQRMMNVVLYALERHLYVSNRWFIALLNFTWEAVIWNTQYRELFVESNGVYMLLDIISMTGPSVQCITLALICDIVRNGQGVGQIVTWRARMRASSTDPMLVKRGATIGTLMATIFREESETCLNLSEDGILQDDDSVMPRKFTSCYGYCSPVCPNTPEPYFICSKTASEMAGSRRSKVFALFHMLSEDLHMKVDLADETYNFYKNINLDVRDEITLVLCSHYLTMKLNDTWIEIIEEYNEILPYDKKTLCEFLQIGGGWNKEIKRQQQVALERQNKKDRNEENSLYAFIARVRLNIALDALKDVRCVARSADRNRITQDMLVDAVHAHHNISSLAKEMKIPILRTYKPPLDEANVIGQNINVCSIFPKDILTRGDTVSPSPTQKPEN